MEYGKKLEQQRQSKNLTIEEVSYKLKINLGTLKKIEASNTAGLPKPAFTKGLIKTYAQFLELDVEEILKDYDESVSPDQLEEKRTGLSDPFEPQAVFFLDFIKDKFIPLLALTIVILAGASLYSFLFQHKMTNDEKVLSELSKEQAEESADLVEESSAVEEESEVAVEENQKIIEKEEPPPVAKVIDKKILKKNNVLELVPLSDSYIYIKMDGDEQPLRVTLRQDKKKIFEFSSAILETVDAGSIVATLNGRDMGKLGKEGENKTIRFPEK